MNHSMKIFVSAIIAVVVICVVGAFMVIGSPQQERLRRLDAQRIGHLQTIQSAVGNYWQRKESLPSSLDDLVDDMYGNRISKDPTTGLNYEYTIEDKESFILCATFQTEGSGEGSYPSPVKYGGEFKGDDSWHHTKGHVCFTRKIDPNYYKLDRVGPPIPVR